MQKAIGTLLFFAAALVAVNGQELCLAEPMVELNIHVVILRVTDPNLCDNTTLKMALMEQARANYQPPDEHQCQMETLNEASCQTVGRAGRHRVTILLRTNLTCGSSNGCLRHDERSPKNSFVQFEERENSIRTAMRQGRKVSLRHGNARVRIIYFSGRKGELMEVCRGRTVSSIREKLALCSCPEDCPEPVTPGLSAEEECANRGLVHNICGSPCPATCSDPNPFCIFLCTEGCFCPQGLVLDGENCVRPEDCPVETTGTPEEECAARGMVHSTCGSACPATCDNQNPVCIFQCTEGCFCPQGMILDGDRCVNPVDCPVEATMTPEEECAARGMVHSTCGSACPATCDNQNPACIFRCTEGCFCPQGMILDGDRCVNTVDCPVEATITPEEECAARGMVHSTCGSACPATCDHQNPVCIFQCTEGCFCPQGMVLDGDRCVHPVDCPVETTRTPEEECAARGMVHKICGSACPPTCDNRNPICIFQCIEGCFCPEGMVLENGTCLNPENCPIEATRSPEEECSAMGMVHSQCGSACPATCDNPSPICTFQCVQGCFCPSGTVRNGTRCIRSDQCPVEATRSPQEECASRGLVHSNCGSACPPTCDNPNPICTFQCVEGCFCPRGTVSHDGRCILRRQCPPRNTTVAPTTTPPEGTQTTEEVVCPVGMVFRECGSACPPTCDGQPLICTLQCVRGCFCPQGTVPDPDNENSCINPSRCPVKNEQCPSGKIYDNCHSSCLATCDNPETPLVCTLQCVEGCFCPDGMVEDPDNEDNCITLENCPKRVRRAAIYKEEKELNDTKEDQPEKRGKKKPKDEESNEKDAITKTRKNCTADDDGEDEEELNDYNERNGTKNACTEESTGKKNTAQKPRKNGQKQKKEDTSSGNGEVDPSGKKKTGKKGKKEEIISSGEGEEVDPSGKKKTGKKGKKEEIISSGEGEEVDPSGGKKAGKKGKKEEVSSGDGEEVDPSEKKKAGQSKKQEVGSGEDEKKGQKGRKGKEESEGSGEKKEVGAKGRKEEEDSTGEKEDYMEEEAKDYDDSNSKSSESSRSSESEKSIGDYGDYETK